MMPRGRFARRVHGANLRPVCPMATLHRRKCILRSSGDAWTAVERRTEKGEGLADIRIELQANGCDSDNGTVSALLPISSHRILIQTTTVTLNAGFPS